MKRLSTHIALISLLIAISNQLCAQIVFPLQINESEKISLRYRMIQDSSLPHTDVSTHLFSPEDSLFTRFSELKYETGNFYFRLYPNFNLSAGLQEGNQFISSNSVGFYSDISYQMGEHALSLHTGGSVFAGIQPYYMRLLMQQKRIVPGLYSQKLINRTWNTAWEPEVSLQYHSPWLLTLETGIGKQHIGDGLRSLILSEYAPAYPYAGLRTRFAKINYQFRWMILENHSYQPWIDTNAGKYAMMHYLSWNIGKRFCLGLFESIVWSDTESRMAFEAQYLNPIIFFRPVEFSVGSSDNALMGINVHYNISNKVLLYGQFLLDDVQVGQMINDIKYRLGILAEGEQHGWFANKYGGQLGIQYFDALGIKNLLLQTEINAVRPNTYAHNNANQSYSSYYHALAHPLEANFIESISRISYTYKRWNFTIHAMYAHKGLSDINENMGENIFYPVSDAPGQAWIPVSTYGNVILQGKRQRILHFNIDISWAPLNNRRLELFARGFYRKSTVPESLLIKDYGIFIGGRTQLSRLKNFF